MLIYVLKSWMMRIQVTMTVVKSVWAILSDKHNSNLSAEVWRTDYVVDDEFQYYWKEPKIDCAKDNPLDWWRMSENKLSIIAVIATIYLAVPATWASSEWIFSKGEHIISKKRRWLKPEKAGMLIWLSKLMRQRKGLKLQSNDDDQGTTYESDSKDTFLNQYYKNKTMYADGIQKWNRDKCKKVKTKWLLTLNIYVCLC